MELSREIAKRVLEVVDAGLVEGIGEPIPGKMCVEAAVCYALGLPHDDSPPCVHRSVRHFKIHLNDQPWSSPEARAKGLRRLAIAQLGTDNLFLSEEFCHTIAERMARHFLPSIIRADIYIAWESYQYLVPILENGSTEELARALAPVIVRSARSDLGLTSYLDAVRISITDENRGTGLSELLNLLYNLGRSPDTVCAEIAEMCVQLLIELKSPGCQWLDLTEEPKTN